MVTFNEQLAVGLPLLVGLTLIALASLVARHGLHAIHNRFFSALYLLSGLKSITEGLTVPVGGLPVAARFHASSPLFPSEVLLTRVGETCGLLMLPLLFLFVAAFPRPTAWMNQRPWLGTLAFLPSAVVGAVLFAIPYSARFDGSDPRSLLAFDVALGFNVVSTLLTLVAVGWLVRTRRRSPEAGERQQAGFVLAGLMPSFVATWAITVVLLGYRAGSIGAAPVKQVVPFVLNHLSPIFEFLAASLVAFAILKFNLLGVSPKFRLGVKSFAVGFMLVIVFLVVQFVENVILQGQVFSFAGDTGSFLLSGVTGLVLFKPIEMASSKISNRLLPKEQGPLNQAAEVYRAQCRYVLRDAEVTERELAVLRNLRQQLGLNEAQARTIEEQVERVLRVDSPKTGASATTGVQHLTRAQADLDGSAPEVRRDARGQAGVVVHGRPAAPAQPTRPPTTPPAPARKPPAGPGAAPAKPGPTKPGPTPQAARKSQPPSRKP